MPINQKRYIAITSAKGGGTPVPLRELTARLFSVNVLVPTSTTLSFATTDSVKDLFGSASEEYARALFHFGFIGKQVSSARTIQFSRWTDANAAPRITGAKGGQVLSLYTGISDGSLVLTMGGVELDLTGLNFTGAADLDGVATVLETGIQTGTGTQFTAGTVLFDAIRGSFNFLGGDATVVAAITIAAGTAGTDVSGLVGWRNATALLSAGLLAEEPVDAVSNSAVVSNNFGSFAFLSALTEARAVAVATWNDAENVLYQYHLPVLLADYSTLSAALTGLSGVGLTAQGIAGEYHEQLPMAILAATDFTRRGAAQNYMFQKATLTPTVSTDTEADTLDLLRINYYGETQTAGQPRSFYQRGNLMGLETDPVDMGVFANEQWLKDSISAGLMTLLESSDVSANDVGRGQVVGTIQNGTIPTATLNGAISPGRDLTQDERQFVTSITGIETAYLQIETIGYWLDVVIISRTVNQIQEFIAQYTLIYAKNNTVRKVEGSDILI